MQEKTKQVGVAVIAVISLATLAVGGVTVAQAAGTPTHVKACANSKHELVLSVHGRCPKGSRRITLAQPGPRGPRGIQGNPGPSAVFVHRIGNGTTLTDVPATGAVGDLMPINVPAGTYLVTLSFDVGISQETSADLSCGIHYSSMASPVSAATDASVDGSALYQSGATQDVETFGGPTVISMLCSTVTGNSGGTAGVYAGTLTAVNIATNKGAG